MYLYISEAIKTIHAYDKFWYKYNIGLVVPYIIM